MTTYRLPNHRRPGRYSGKASRRCRCNCHQHKAYCGRAGAATAGHCPHVDQIAIEGEDQSACLLAVAKTSVPSFGLPAPLTVVPLLPPKVAPGDVHRLLAAHFANRTVSGQPQRAFLYVGIAAIGVRAAQRQFTARPVWSAIYRPSRRCRFYRPVRW